EIAVDAAVGAGDADTLVVLDAGALTLDHAHADAHGVARAEFGAALGLAESGDGFRFELLGQAHDGFLQSTRCAPEADGSRAPQCRSPRSGLRGRGSPARGRLRRDADVAR